MYGIYIPGILYANKETVVLGEKLPQVLFMGLAFHIICHHHLPFQY
jgi:hypothetical protein